MPTPLSSYISPMPRFYPFAVTVDGRRYTGDWHLMLGGRLCVRSAYGSETAEIGRARPETVAPKVLERIVRADQKRRADERARQEREAARLAGRGRKSPGA